MIIRAVKKPVKIHAVIWNGSLESFYEVSTFVNGGDIHKGKIPDFWKENGKHALFKGGFKITTLEGVMSATLGDYIIKGVNGEFYPCKPDIFEKTYHIVNNVE
ncbi:hypothetical protein Acj9p046 [Acinetobacter phage Acj9]|uniref:Uncharacterized protein n=1 Tax=Acinetobacter phage Acj9 TaxID=760939 RepID=E5EPI0_9CAUD|nr:hypothetical protein Acj9p046 [Acinetobacter phage Acj9]ADG59946.1 conserved hypothetical protein [Acinetobacter phage Acj9]